jgi:2'-hydroxyisoflavone reductase
MVRVTLAKKVEASRMDLVERAEMSIGRREFLRLGAVGSLATLAAPTLGAYGPSLAHAPVAPLKILVLGGTRYLGPAVVRAGLARGHIITLFNRGKTRPGLFPGVVNLLGNRYPDLGDGLKALQTGRWDAVIDLCAYYPRLVEASAQMLKSRVDRYIMLSSISVYKDFKQPNLDESAAIRPLAEKFDELPDLAENDWATYGGRKAAGEEIVGRVFGERATILRPCTICGGENNDGSGAYWASRLHTDSRILIPGDGSDPVQIIDVGDVADFAILSAERRLSGTFNLVGPEKRLTLREYVASCARVVNSRARVIWKGDFPREMNVFPIAAPFERVPGFATIRNDKARDAGLRFRPLEETLRCNWVDHRARRGDGFDFAAAGMGLSREAESTLIDSTS